jgi:DNA-damage-inducible protein J
MTADAVVRARIDVKTKEAASEALATMGLTVSDYIRLALIRVAQDKAVPFPIKAPNALTAETLRKAERGEDVFRANDAEELFKELGI